MQNPPALVSISTSGIWCAYFPAQTQPGDNTSHQLDIIEPQGFGNETLFTPADKGVALTHRSLVQVNVHAVCRHEIMIERDLLVQLDKGASGGLMDRGESKFVAGLGNSAYQGILEEGHIVRAAVNAPGDQVEILGGYVSVIADP